MAGLDDLMARSSAAGGMMGAGDMGADPSMLPGPTPETEPDAESVDLEAGASIIEAFADSVDPQTGDQIREHLNAIRELAAEGVPTEEAEPSPEEIAAGPELPPEAMGQMP
jgi:hypothetical protein